MDTLFPFFVAGSILFAAILLQALISQWIGLRKPVEQRRSKILQRAKHKMYTGYDNQRKPTEAKNLFFRQDPLIGSGVLLILFVILVTITSLFHIG